MCSACQLLNAEGTCPNCRVILCTAFYNVHPCPPIPALLDPNPAPIVLPPNPSANLQCSKCYAEPAACVCVCKFPCPVFCTVCYNKHAAGLPIHFSLPLQYQQSLHFLEPFNTCKARFANMHRLYTDISTTLGKLSDFRKDFERKLGEVLGKLEEMRENMVAEIDRAQRDLQEQENCLTSCFADILMSSAARPNSQICALIDKNYPLIATFERHLDFSPVILALKQTVSFESNLLNQLRPRLPGQEDANLHSDKSNTQHLCSLCQKRFTAPAPSETAQMQAIHTDLWTDFCSLACLQQFKKLYLEIAKP